MPGATAPDRSLYDPYPLLDLERAAKWCLEAARGVCRSKEKDINKRASEIESVKAL